MLTKKQQSLSKICDDLGISNSELCKICFEQGEKEEYFKCKICPIERKKGSGYSNLLTHLEKHPPSTIKDLILQEKGAKAGPMNFHVRGLSDDAKTYHDWIEWIVMWPKARVVQSPAFEEAIVKLQKGQTLNPAEKKLVSVFKVIPKESAAEETDENLSYEDELLRDVERSNKQAGATNEYRSTYHVSPTSNIVERLFSVAGIIMRPHRRQMDPWSLELLIMLRANKDMWKHGTLQKIIDTRKKENRDAAIARSNASAASKRQRENDQESEEGLGDGEV